MPAIIVPVCRRPYTVLAVHVFFTLKLYTILGSLVCINYHMFLQPLESYARCHQEDIFFQQDLCIYCI
jgi:hypothetical protein